jgi:hypothetical protein
LIIDDAHLLVAGALKQIVYEAGRRRLRVIFVAKYDREIAQPREFLDFLRDLPYTWTSHFSDEDGLLLLRRAGIPEQAIDLARKEIPWTTPGRIQETIEIIRKVVSGHRS